MSTLLINPIQPYFRICTHKNYQARYVNRDGISHFYTFTLEDAALAMSVVPDGSIDIIIKLDDNKPEAWVCGSLREISRTFMQQGCSYFGVRYQIGVVPSFLDLTPKDIIDQTIALQSIFNQGVSLIDVISSCDNFEQQIKSFYLVCDRPKALIQVPELSQKLFHLMLNFRGNVTIPELCNHSGYSARTVRNSFKDYYGLSPKAFNMMLRYQQVLEKLMQNEDECLINLATDMGYSDQSHFSREFKRYNGQSPKEFQNTVKQSML